MTDPSPAVTAIVLAAGRSSRMGRDKALLDLDGEPALSRVLRVLREAGVARRVVVVSRVTPRLARAVELEGVTVAINHDPDAGQARSIRIGLCSLPPASEAFLLCPVDVPLFEESDVRALVAAFVARAPGIAIVVPGDGSHRGHPALFARDLAAEFRALRDGEPANAVIRGDPARVLHVDLGNPELYADLDREQDYEAAIARLRERRRPA